MPLEFQKGACLTAALLACFCSCAGSSAMPAFAPKPSFAAGAMDETHEENFTMPPIDKKDNVGDKAGQVILGVALVGAVVGSAIIIPLLAADKL